MQPSFGCMGVSSAVRFGATFRILPDQKGRKSKSPPNQPMVGRGTLGFIDYSECLPGPPVHPPCPGTFSSATRRVSPRLALLMSKRALLKLLTHGYPAHFGA
jgi:hypothetical protein